MENSNWIIILFLFLGMTVGLAAVILWNLNSRLRREIRERQIAEEELQNREDMMRSIFRVAPTGIGVVVDRVMRDVNPRFCEMLGYSRQELIGQSALMVYPTREDFEYVGQEKYRQIAEGGTGTVETRFLKKDGEIIHVLMGSTPIDENDHQKGVTFTAQDITEMKRVQLAIRESEELFRTTVEAMHEGFLVTDQNFKPIFANRRFLELTGLQEHELADADITEFLDEESLERVMSEFGEKAFVGEPVLIEICGIRKDGEKRYFTLSGSSIMKDGNFEKGVSIYTDITDRKLTEEQMRASLREKETLLQEVHHRVKNNMAVIGSLLKLQAGNIDNEEVKSILNESRNRVFAMSAVHESLYKSDSLAAVNMKEYITKISKALFHAYSVHASRVRLSIESDESELMPEIASPLGLVLNELMSNSLKYAFADELSGEIRVCLEKNNGELTISVLDDGIGMPDDFDWQKTSSLGFQLVRTLVNDQLNGQIRKLPGPGTGFQISIARPDQA